LDETAIGQAGVAAEQIGTSASNPNKIIANSFVIEKL
jgi:hypothetical protein